MTDPLTAAELADIEALGVAWDEANARLDETHTDRAWAECHDAEYAYTRAVVEAWPRLLAALREARALVEALLEYGKPWRTQNEYPDYGGPDTYCPVCKHETWGVFVAGLHAPDCGLMAAWNALARWRGDKPAE